MALWVWVCVLSSFESIGAHSKNTDTPRRSRCSCRLIVALASWPVLQMWLLQKGGTSQALSTQHRPNTVG